MNVSSLCVGGVLAVSDGFPDNLAIVGDAFLKSYEYSPLLFEIQHADDTQGTRSMITRMVHGSD